MVSRRPAGQLGLVPVPKPPRRPLQVLSEGPARIREVGKQTPAPDRICCKERDVVPLCKAIAAGLLTVTEMHIRKQQVNKERQERRGVKEEISVPENWCVHF